MFNLRSYLACEMAVMGLCYLIEETKEDVNHLPQKNPSPYPEMSPIVIHNAGVYKLLSQLNQHKACGTDNNPAVFLKSCALELTNMLSFIIQQSLDTQTLPLDWRKALVTPVFKKGDKSNPENYQPVSLTCMLQNCSTHHCISGHDSLRQSRHTCGLPTWF